jgi:hypothetical protein
MRELILTGGTKMKDETVRPKRPAATYAVLKVAAKIRPAATPLSGPDWLGIWRDDGPGGDFEYLISSLPAFTRLEIEKAFRELANASTTAFRSAVRRAN